MSADSPGPLYDGVAAEIADNERIKVSLHLSRRQYRAFSAWLRVRPMLEWRAEISAALKSVIDQLPEPDSAPLSRRNFPAAKPPTTSDPSGDTK